MSIESRFVARACRAAIGATVTMVAFRAPAADSPSLDDLRRDVAVHYFEPEAHLRLARYHREHGNSLLAFYISEGARRGQVDPDEFKAAFRRIFVDKKPFDNSKEAEARLKKQIADQPEAEPLLIDLADIYLSHGNWAPAKELLQKAIRLAPEDHAPVVGLAEVHRREEHDDLARAVEAAFITRNPGSVEAVWAAVAAVAESDPPKARALVEAALVAHPKEALLHVQLAAYRAVDSNLDAAEKEYLTAVDLDPRSAVTQGSAGRFFLKTRKDDARALAHYLEAYFADSEYYDGEYAEGRIRGIAYTAGHAEYETLRSKGASVASLLAHENPVVVDAALETLADTWQPEHLVPVSAMLANDDESIRAQALDVLERHLADVTDAQLDLLRSSSDLRQRGMSAYLVVKRRGAKGIEQVTPWLADEAELLRFDAISALVLEGGKEGRKVLASRRGKEKHPQLAALLADLPALPKPAE